MTTQPALIASVLALTLAACAAPPASGPTRLVGAQSSLRGPGPLYLCQITADDEEGFLRADRLHCELPETAVFRTVSLEVWADGDAYLGNARLDSGPLDLIVRSEHYPIRILADVVPTPDEAVGFDDIRLRSALVVTEAEELPDPLGPELPFDIWDVTFAGEAESAQLDFDAYTLTANGPLFRHEGVETDSVTVDLLGFIVREGDEKNLRIPVPRGTDAVTGYVSYAPSAQVPFSIDEPGTLRVGEDGLAHTSTSSAATAVPERFPLIACQGYVSLSECRLVARTGIDIAQVEVVVDGARISLPKDGSWLEIPYGETHAGRVVIERGVDGVSLFQHGTVEGLLTPASAALADDDEGTPIAATLEAPFDLIHAVVNVGPRAAVIFETGAHEISLPDGSVVSEALQAMATDRDRDVWIAVSHGVTEVAVDVRIIRGDGSRESLSGFALSSETLVLSEDGLAPPQSANPVDEVASCWLDGGGLNCRVSEAHDLESASVSVQLEGGVGDGRLEASLLSSADGERVFDDLGEFFPLTIELRATVQGQDEDVQRIRVLHEADLRENARLVIDAG